MIDSLQVHIDGHSDEALPQLFDGVPFFEWPSTDDQVQALMQKNDVFILVSNFCELLIRRGTPVMLDQPTMMVFLIIKLKYPWQLQNSQINGVLLRQSTKTCVRPSNSPAGLLGYFLNNP